MSQRFTVRVSRRAIRDLKEVYAWIAEDSRPAADAWLASTEAQVASLATSPLRCGLAREVRSLPGAVRQLVVGNYRALFVVEGSVVHVLHVRHAAMDDARAEDLT